MVSFISSQRSWKRRPRGRTRIRSNRASDSTEAKASRPRAKHSARDVAARITPKHKAS